MRAKQAVLAMSLFVIATSSGASAQSEAKDFAQRQQERIEQLRTVPVELDQPAEKAIAGINEFSLKLYKDMVEEGENHFISPASVSTAMSLAYRAAKGPTADEIRHHLHYSGSPEEYLQATSGVLETLNFQKGSRELATANSIWVDRSVTLAPDYLADTVDLAGSSVEQVDFRSDHEAARLQINDWVAANTNDRIEDLLSKDMVRSSTRSILVNTIYWKGNWGQSFKVENTEKKPFRQFDGSKVKVDMMFQEGRFRAIEHDGVKAILLPYEGREMEMAVFLPNSARGLPKFEAGLDMARLSEWFEKLDEVDYRKTELSLPRMRIEWGEDIVPTFKDWGMETSFGKDADFSAIATEEEDEGVLGIGKVIHKTYLDVDEKGSEAAAATAVAVIVVVNKRPADRSRPFIFKADHPFFFVLRDRRTDLITFMGRYGMAASAN